MTETEKNQRIADRICEEFQWNGRRFVVGDWVALLDGNIVTVTRSVDEALHRLRSADPDPRRGMLLQVGPQTVDVIR
jgi:hypothetical protein